MLALVGRLKWISSSDLFQFTKSDTKMATQEFVFDQSIDFRTVAATFNWAIPALTPDRTVT